MKMIKKLFVAFVLCAPLTAAAQGVEINETNFPDASFRKYISFYEDRDNNGVLSDEEIQEVTSIYVSGMGISSLKGIEYFTALTDLQCINNELTSLDVSACKSLTNIHCSRNMIKGEAMEAFINSLPEVAADERASINIYDALSGEEGNMCTKSQVAAAAAKGWTMYYCTWRSEDGKSSRWGVYKGGEIPEDVTIDATNFPDDNFRAYLLEQNYGEDEVLTGAEIWNTYAIIVNNKNISDLKGIEYFTEISYLNCENNQLESLNVTKNTGLQTLYCDNNQLTSLDVSANVALVELSCTRNQISGKAMDALIGSLPENTTEYIKAIYVYDNSELDENNICTKAQVAAIKGKGWTPFYYNTTENFWMEYEGSDDLTSITVAVSADGIATYCPEYDVDFSSATTIAAYKASVNGNTVNLTRVETVAAGEGVLIRSLNGGAVEEELPIAADATANEDNAFVGVLEATTLSKTEGNATNFVLSKVDGVVGFFKANNTQLAAGKAYLPVENYNAARSLTIVFDDTTGIIEVAPEQADDDAAVYTLGGVRTTTPQNGLYIKNGKKVMVK